MSVELQGLCVVMQVKISVAQLTVDGTQHLKVLCAHLDGSFKEGDACSVVAHLTEPLPLQRQLQARHLHPAANTSTVSLENSFTLPLLGTTTVPPIQAQHLGQKMESSGLIYIFSDWNLQQTDWTSLATREQNLFLSKALLTGSVGSLPSTHGKQWLQLGFVCYGWSHFL